MAGVSRIHSLLVTSLVRSLANQLFERRCNVFSSDLRVGVGNGEHYVYPDVVVTCGQERFEDEELDTLLNPLLIVEVLSPSTEAYDRGEKFRLYQTIESLQEYVLVSQQSQRIEVYRKQPDGFWLYQSWPSSEFPVRLTSIDCTLDLDEVYLKVESQRE
jgi:Uma2 family endonuclease